MPRIYIALRVHNDKELAIRAFKSVSKCARLCAQANRFVDDNMFSKEIPTKLRKFDPYISEINMTTHYSFQCLRLDMGEVKP